MKIANINFTYPVGSTGKLVQAIDCALRMNGSESLIYYGRGAKYRAPNVYKFCCEFEAKIHSLLVRLGLRVELGGAKFATYRLINKLKKEKPDLVHIHCLNGSCVDLYQLLKYLSRYNIKTIITHHAEFYYTGVCAHAEDCVHFTNYPGCGQCPRPQRATKQLWGDCTRKSWSKMKQSFTQFSPSSLMFIAVSPWVKFRSELSPIVRGFPCEVVLNGVDTKTFHRTQSSAILSKLSGSYKYHLLFVTASFDMVADSNKGGNYIVELAKLMPECVFIVVALHIGELNNLPSNVVIWGKVHSQEKLAELYSSVDLSLIASKRETFSMIVAESLCCGTPVVGFNAGGPETITMESYSKFVEYGNIDAYRNAIYDMLDKPFDREVIAHEAASKYDIHLMTEKLFNIYKKMINE